MVCGFTFRPPKEKHLPQSVEEMPKYEEKGAKVKTSLNVHLLPFPSLPSITARMRGNQVQFTVIEIFSASISPHFCGNLQFSFSLEILAHGFLT